MKAYILHSKVHDVIGPDHAAYTFPAESWHPAPEALFEFDYVYTPYIVAQETPYDATRKWFDAAYVLKTISAEKAKDFDAALLEVDTKSARGDRGGLLAVYEAFEYKEPLGEKAVEDINILWELESVAQENRLMLDRLLALKVTDDMTTEEAQAVLLQAMAIEPWLPWKPKESAPPTEAPPIEPIPEREPTQPLSPPAGFTVNDSAS